MTMSLEDRLRANVEKAKADLAWVEHRLNMAEEGEIPATKAQIEQTTKQTLPMRQALLKRAENDLAEYLEKKAKREETSR
jgi:hypothetical protein